MPLSRYFEFWRFAGGTPALPGVIEGDSDTRGSDQFLQTPLEIGADQGARPRLLSRKILDGPQLETNPALNHFAARVADVKIVNKSVSFAKTLARARKTQSRLDVQDHDFFNASRQDALMGDAGLDGVQRG